MRRKKSSGLGFTIVFFVVLLIAMFYVVGNNNKEKKYGEIVNSDLTAAEKAEKLRNLGYKNQSYSSAESAEVYRLLADGDYVQAREKNEEYGSCIPDFRFTEFIENELTDADEKLIAYHDLFDLTGTKAETYQYAYDWLPDDDGSMGTFGHVSMLGYSQEEDLIAACGSSPVEGKLLILYKLNDAAIGANLDAMGSIGEEAWPQSLSEVSHILEIDYSVPDFPERDYSKTGTQVVTRTASYTITLMDIAGNVIYEETLKGEMPDSTWVTQNAYNERTYKPGWSEVRESINKAFLAAGLEWKAPEE